MKPENYNKNITKGVNLNTISNILLFAIINNIVKDNKNIIT